MFVPGRMCPVITLDTDNSLFYWWRRDCREKKTNHCSLTLFSHLNRLINLYWLPAPRSRFSSSFNSLHSALIALARSSWSPWRSWRFLHHLCPERNFVCPLPTNCHSKVELVKRKIWAPEDPVGCYVLCIRRYSESLKKKIRQGAVEPENGTRL